MEIKQGMEPPAGGINAVDRETFERVWRRVMPDQENAPIEVVGKEQWNAASGAQSQVPAQLPQQTQPERKPQPQLGQRLPQTRQETPPHQAETCLGMESGAYIQQLQEMMDGEQLSWRTYRGLARRAGRNAQRTLAVMANQQRENLRRLAAAYYLITGEHYQPAGMEPATISPLSAALRDQFIQEQKWQRAFQSAAGATGDPCLKTLYQELAQMAQDHQNTVRRLLEQMQPMPMSP